MAKGLIKQVSFKQTEIDLFNAIKKKDFSYYVKELIRRDLDEREAINDRWKKETYTQPKEMQQEEEAKAPIKQQKKTKEEIDLKACFKINENRDEIDL